MICHVTVYLNLCIKMTYFMVIKCILFLFYMLHVLLTEDLCHPCHVTLVWHIVASVAFTWLQTCTTDRVAVVSVVVFCCVDTFVNVYLES